MGLSLPGGDHLAEHAAVAASDGEFLTIESAGRTHFVRPGNGLRFGRVADLVVDDNPFMHRVVGRFVHREGVWWLQNHASRSRIELRDLDHHTTLQAAPGQQLPVIGHSFAVNFTAGPTAYELHGRREGPAVNLDDSGDVVGTATIDFGTIPLSPEQHLLIVSLYESSLRCDAIEGNSVIARRLGWTPKKFHRKLDAVCDKLHKSGVPGVRGQLGELAETRRDSLVAHAVRTGLVSPDDLGML